MSGALQAPPTGDVDRPAQTVWLDTVDSTNAETARRAAAGDPGPLWVAARRQTAARARRGRTWAMGQGNLAASLLIRPAMPPATAALASFAACLAVGELLDYAAPGHDVAFKWPNDALLDGCKVAGVLLEAASARERVAWLVIGIGVNLAEGPPPDALRPGATPPIALAAATGRAPTPEQALAVLAPALARWLHRLQHEGFAPLRRAWLARAARLGETIGAGLADERLEGRFVDVDDTGALVLITTGGHRRVVTAADIFFPG
ncbi:MAG: biotin--[acetyl-CoA-carboxylase] ligase [Pseudomonadota bacterium]